ncbi:MAG: hypothetical protein DRP79_09115 [Planctomycetota bacterium]|nr:MAG: hypothetical protein DRP79_09115 [Planctomycetota bacterium]
MADRKYSPHQQRIIKNYYENLENIQNQKLGELIADVYLAETDKKKASLWKRVEKVLTHLKVHPKTVAYIVKNRDIETLSEIASELF